MTAKADGPEGARLALSFAEMALELFEDAQWGSQALARALTADANLDEYTALLPYADELAKGGDVEPLFALAVRPYTNVGIGAYRLLARIAELRGEGSRASDMWSRAAARDPEDAAPRPRRRLALPRRRRAVGPPAQGETPTKTARASLPRLRRGAPPRRGARRAISGGKAKLYVLSLIATSPPCIAHHFRKWENHLG